MDGPSLQALGAAAALGSAATWAVTSLLVRRLMPPYTSVGVGAIRSCVGGALLLGTILLLHGPGPLLAIPSGSLALLVVSIVAAICVGDTAFFESTRRLGLARGMSISTTYPLVAAVLAAAFLDEPLTARVAIGALLTLSGVLLIVVRRPEPGLAPEDGWWLGVAGAVIASVAWGVSAVALKPALRDVDAVTAQAVRLPIAGALLFVTPWARGTVSRLRRERTGLRSLVVLGLLTSVSSVMFVVGLQHAGVAVGSALSATAPMFAIPLGLVFLRERLTAAPIVGSAVTIAGIAVLQA
ncbi:MAG: DMT family transporter [Candidatus Rokuibacteriota bacterium]